MNHGIVSAISCAVFGGVLPVAGDCFIVLGGVEIFFFKFFCAATVNAKGEKRESAVGFPNSPAGKIFFAKWGKIKVVIEFLHLKIPANGPKM